MFLNPIFYIQVFVVMLISILIINIIKELVIQVFPKMDKLYNSVENILEIGIFTIVAPVLIIVSILETMILLIS